MISPALAIFGSLISIHATAHRPSSKAQDLTVDQVVSQAIAASPRLRAAVLDMKAAEFGVASARSLTNPVVTFTPGFTRAGSDEELLISQPLEISGTRSARAGIASAEWKATRAQAVLELRTLVSETKAAFYELSRLQGKVRLAKEHWKSSTDLEAIASRQIQLGSRAGIELSQIKIESTRAKQHVTLAEVEYKSKLSELNLLMGRPMAESLTTASADIQPQILGESEAINLALIARAELDLIRARQEGYKKEASLARAEGLPDLSPHYRAESVTREPRNGGFGVAVSLPIFDYGSRKNRIRQAETSAKAETERLAAIQLQIRQEVVHALARLSAADEVVRNYRNGLLDESRKVLEASKKGYELGETNLVSLLEAQRTHRAVQIEYLDALASLAQAQIALERAMGSIPASLLPTPDRKEVSQ